MKPNPRTPKVIIETQEAINVSIAISHPHLIIPIPHLRNKCEKL